MSGKVVVNRSMSLDGFIAGPGDAMNWIFDFVAPDAAWLTETAAATGAMLIGRRTDEVGSRMEAGEERGTASRGEGYPFSGPMFVLTHEPPDRRTRRSRTSPVTSGKRSPRHWTLRAGRTSKSSALTWPVSACGEDSWTRSWCMSCRCCSATASGSTPPRSREDRPGTARQHAVGSRHHPSLPRPRVVIGVVLRPGVRSATASPSVVCSSS